MSKSASCPAGNPAGRGRRWLGLWLPLLAWMGMIFSASSDSGSFQHSSRILEPLLRWLVPQLSPEGLHACIVAVRKGAHLSEYAVLAVLLWRVLRGAGSGPLGRWSWRLAGGALLGVLLYAVSDEWHQSFVPSREGSLVDVPIDTAGGGLGLLLLWAGGKCFKRW